MKMGERGKFGKNPSANEENSNHAFSARRNDRRALLGLSRPQQARANGGGHPKRAISLGCVRYPAIRRRRNFRRLSLARFAKGSKDSSDYSASIGLVFNRHVLQPVPAGGHRWR